MEKGDMRTYVVLLLIIGAAVFLSSIEQKKARAPEKVFDKDVDIPTGYPVRTVNREQRPARTQKTLQPTGTLKQLYDAGKPVSSEVARVLIPGAFDSAQDDEVKSQTQSLEVLYDAGNVITDQTVIDVLTGGKP